MLAALAVGVAARPRRASLSIVLAAAAVVALAVVVATSSHHLFAAPSDRTSVGWRTATHDWTSVAITGRGPQGVSNLRSPVRVSANLIGDDYLQLGVDAGLVGLVLLGACVASVAAVVRRRDATTSAAVGAVIAFGVAGALDFSWHLPAVALAGGMVAGLAAVPVGTGWGLHAAWRAHRIRAAVGVAAVLALAAGIAVVRSGAGSPVPAARAAAGPASQLPTSRGPTAAGSSPVSSSAASSNAGPAPSIPSGPGQLIASGPDLTDPFILHHGGRLYLYTSEGATAMNVPVRVGTSITSWGPAREALPALPSWAVSGATWAPDVRPVAGGYALYFSALVRGMSPATHCVGAAFGSSPVGPFVADDQPFVCQLDHRGTIDPRTFVDADGQLVLDFKSEDNANPGVAGPDQTDVPPSGPNA